MTTLEELQRVIASLPKAKTTWDGESIRVEPSLLPYETKDIKTGKPTTVHAVICDRVLLVSQKAWDALMGAAK